MLLFIASLYVLSKKLYKKMYKKMYLLCIAFLCQLNKFFFMLLIFVGLSRVEGWTKVALKSSYGVGTSDRGGIVFYGELSPSDISF